MGSGYYAYRVTVYLIHLWKSFELWCMKLMPSVAEKAVKRCLAKAGVTINGDQPWDIRVKDKEFAIRFASMFTLGAGESYMDGHWDCDDLTELLTRILRSRAYTMYFNPWNRFLNYMECTFFNLQDKQKAWEVGEQHYDLGNDLFESFLGKHMNYSCGYWRTASNLDEAQYAKMELIAEKLNLKPGMKVLDIGSGWGSLCQHLAKKYGVSCVGVTISKEQIAYAKKRCKGLAVEFRLMDYRDINDQFDRIVSVGMFEHVGKNNYDDFFKVAHQCLKDDGIFLLHSMGNNHYDLPSADPWTQKYIFPNCDLPYYKDVMDAIEKRFIIEDWHNFGYDYSKTLVGFYENFNKNWPKIESKYGPRFYRLWKYFLLLSVGMFKSRKLQLWQIVLSKDGIEGGYHSAR